jgi:hypothetical protein
LLCNTDAFTKYAGVTAIANKAADTVADAIYKEWFSKFGIPAQIQTDRGKEFVNKLSAKLFQLLNVSHTKTSPAHPQCKAQLEVFNKTVKKSSNLLWMTPHLTGTQSFQHWLSVTILVIT